MITRRSVLAGAATVIARPAIARSLRLGSIIPGPISTVTYGTAFKYNSQYPTKYIDSDVWTSTWADDNNIYVAHDDSMGWQGATPTSNFAISQFSDYSTSLTGTMINTMQPWGTLGQTGSDCGANPYNTSGCANYKACGMVCVNGVLYVATSRQIYGNYTTGVGVAAKQTGQNAQIIKESGTPPINHTTSTWTPQPPSTAAPYASPMFPGSKFGTPFFIQYGQNYTGQTVDNANNYLYAVSNDGWWNNGSSLYLGRVALTNLPNLLATDWTFYLGGDGMVSGNWGTLANAVSIVASPLRMSMQAIQYMPAFGCYVMIQWWYPSIVNNVTNVSSSSQWDFWQAPHPWGPWQMLPTASKVWNTQPGKGLYNPCIIPKSLQTDGGRTAMIATAGDYQSQNTQTGDYTLTLVSMTCA